MMSKDHNLDKINWANLQIALQERSKGLCEVCNKAEPLVIHHILGRDAPKGFKAFPEEVRLAWPHCELTCIVLSLAVHGSADRTRRMHTALRHNSPALLALLLVKYGERVWEGKTYEEWFAQPWLREMIVGKGGDVK